MLSRFARRSMRQVGGMPKVTDRLLAPSVGSRPYSADIDVTRNPAFKVIGDSDIAHFESILPKGNVITDKDEI